MDQRKTVLLADAGEEFRTLLWEEMEKTGEFSVEIARDGNEILKRVKERMPDLLVMDVMLPDRKSTRLNSSHRSLSRMPSSA